MSTRYDTGGTDFDGAVYDASFECEDCGFSLSWPVTQGLPAAQDPVAAPMLAMIADHEDGACPSRQLQRERLHQFPKDLYFNAEDHNVGPDALPEGELAVIRNRRYAIHRRLCTLLEDLQHAAKPLKAFDRNGNIGMAAANLMDTALVAQKVLRNLTLDIAEAEQRFREQSDLVESPTPAQAPVSAEPTPQALTDIGSLPAVVEPAPQAPATAGPKPGPHLTTVHVFDPTVSTRDQLAAFDRAAAAGRMAKTGGFR